MPTVLNVYSLLHRELSVFQVRTSYQNTNKQACRHLHRRSSLLSILLHHKIHNNVKLNVTNSRVTERTMSLLFNPLSSQSLHYDSYYYDSPFHVLYHSYCARMSSTRMRSMNDTEHGKGSHNNRSHNEETDFSSDRSRWEWHKFKERW